MPNLIRVLVKDLRVGSHFDLISGVPGKVLQRSVNGFGTSVQLKRTTEKVDYVLEGENKRITNSLTTSTSVQYEKVTISENCPVWVKR